MYDEYLGNFHCGMVDDDYAPDLGSWEPTTTAVVTRSMKHLKHTLVTGAKSYDDEEDVTAGDDEEDTGFNCGMEDSEYEPNLSGWSPRHARRPITRSMVRSSRR